MFAAVNGGRHAHHIVHEGATANDVTGVLAWLCRQVVTVERIHDGNFLADPKLAAGTLPGFYVETIAVAERGCWPLPLPEHYAWDAEHLKEYAKLAATDEGFAQYLEQYVYARQAG